MNQIEFLKERINSSIINTIQSALYEYNDFSGTHFVKLVPTEIVDGKEFDLLLSQIIIDFEDNFQGEMLCFLGESSLTKLENPEELLPVLEITHLLQQILPFNFNTLFTSDILNQYTLSIGNEHIIIPSISVNHFLPIINIGEMPFYKRFEFNDMKSISIAAEPTESYSTRLGETSLSLAA